MHVATDPWFSRRPAGGGIWHVSEPYVDSFARCNIWIVPGATQVLVVDTGMGLVSLHRAQADLFDRPVTAVATHYHFDHVGSLHEFPVRLAHHAGAELLSDSHSIGGALHRRGFDPRMWQAFLDAGYTLDRDDLLTALPYAGYDIDSYAVEPCTPTRVLEEGDVIDIGDRAFTVLHLPGHSPDSIGLHDAEHGVLFSGDAVYDGPLLDDEPADLDRYVATMERLRALDVEVIHGGHEASFGRDRLVELCDGYIVRAATRR